MFRILLLVALLVYVVRGGAMRMPQLPGWLRAPWAEWLGAGLLLLGTIGEFAQHGQESLLSPALSGLALLLMLANAYLRRRPRMEVLESVLLPLAVLLLLLSLIAPGDNIGAPLSWWLPVHIGFTVFGFGGFALTFALSVLYLWVRRRLKEKQLIGISRLPSLAALDDLNQRCMTLGFVLLSAGILSGVLWGTLGNTARGIVPDITVYATVMVWLWYAAGLYIRLFMGQRGRTAAWFGVVGFFGVALIIVSAALVFNSFHGVIG